jgi:hypothetical protein
MVGKFCANIWEGQHIYKIMYEVLYSIDEIPYPETDVCYGAKCHEYIPLSFDNWCMDCHGHPDDGMVSRMIHIMLRESDDYMPLEFSQISDYVTKISVISAEDITQTNSLYIKHSRHMFRTKEKNETMYRSFCESVVQTSRLVLRDNMDLYNKSRKIRRIG